MEPTANAEEGEEIDFDSGLNEFLKGGDEVPPPSEEEEEPLKGEEEPPEEEEKEEDDLDDFKVEREKSKEPKKTKKDSVVELRKQRDEIRQSLDSYKEAAGDFDPEAIKAIREHFESNAGDELPTADSIKATLQEAQDAKEEANRLKEQLEEKDKRIRDLDIRSSEEFQSQYLRPLQDASSSLQVELANFDDNGEVIAPKATQAFHKEIMDMEDPDPKKIKQSLAKFSKKFSEESGMDYTQPSVHSTMSALRAYKKANEKVVEAYQNWENEKKNAVTKQQKEQEEQQQFRVQQDKRERRAAAIKGLREFDFDKVEGVFEDKEIEQEFKNVFKDQENILDDPQKMPSYDFLMQQNAKARLFDKLAEKHREAVDRLKEYESEDEDTAKNRGVKKKSANQKADDWLPEQFQ